MEAILFVWAKTSGLFKKGEKGFQQEVRENKFKKEAKPMRPGVSKLI